MPPITVQLTAVAHCPLSAQVNVNTALTGDHGYSVTNNTDDSININIEIELRDSESSGISESRPFAIAPGGTERGTLRSAFAKLYSSTGPRQLTAITRVTGAVSGIGSGSCSFQVSSK